MDYLIDQAKNIIAGNDTGTFIKPGPRQYPHQWNWDTAFIVFGLSHYDPTRAQNEIRALLSGQWKNGMVPQIVYHNAESDYFPSASFWQIESSPDAPSVPTSGISQPALLATGLCKLHQRAPMLEFVREVYPKILAWHRWWHTIRDPHNEGLVSVVHPWESGIDNTPRWDEALGRISADDIPSYERGDKKHVDASQRPTSFHYDRFIYLVDFLRKNQYDQATLMADCPFLFQDVLSNAVLHRADKDLRELAIELGEDTRELDSWIAHTHEAFNAKFWDTTDDNYYDFDVRAGKLNRINTCASFVPMFAGLPSQAQAQALVEKHLLDGTEYAPNNDTLYFVPSLAKNSPYWEPRRYVRGAVWIMLNWMVIQGCRDYGFDALADSIHAHTMELVEKTGFYEYYDPRDGSGCGSTDFSWTAAVVIDLIKGVR